ncbi:hypothetical protein JCM8202_000542 [Rhodotorula sphaerocarpa]
MIDAGNAAVQPPSAPLPDRPHACPHPGCTARYARVEHLDRHAKSHDPAHAYQCEKCGKSFARTDVLQRHLKIHERDYAAETTDAKSADLPHAPSSLQSEPGRVRSLNRVSRACRPCASAKAKCSGGQPCQRCVELKRSPQCEYPASTRPSKRVRIGSYDSQGSSVPPADSASINTRDSIGGDISVTASGVARHGSSPPPPSYLPSGSSSAMRQIPPQPPVAPVHAAPRAQPLAASEFMAFDDPATDGNASDSAQYRLPLPAAATLLPDAASSSNETLDDFVSLALQQQQPQRQDQPPQLGHGDQPHPHHQHPAANPTQFPGFPGPEAYGGFPSSLEADLAAAFYLPTDDTMFWSSFLTSPPSAPYLASNPGATSAPVPASALATSHAPAGVFSEWFDAATASAMAESGPSAAGAGFGAAGETARPAGAGRMHTDVLETSPATSTSSLQGRLQSSQQRRRRIMITASGLPSRHGSPKPESDDGRGGGGGEGGGGPEGDTSMLAQGGGDRGAIEGSEAAGEKEEQASTKRTAPSWPMVWDPTGDESAVRLENEASLSLLMIGGASLSGAAGRIPKFDDDTRIALLETLRFGQLSDDEYHAIYRSLAKIPLSVFDFLCGLYFQHFHRIMPMFHVPSFSPKKTLGQLLLTILGIGAIYAPVPGAYQLGRVMVEVARRGIEHLINRDNRLARSLPVAQSQLLACTLRWIGSARTIEMTEALRGVHVAILRRLRVFDESLLHQATDGSPLAQWKAFIANEERRRTAMACFVLEGEVTTLMHTPPVITASEIKTLLPCPETLWEAPTAEAWLDLKRDSQESMSMQSLAKLLASESSIGLPNSIALAPFSAHVLVQGLHLMVHNARQLQLSGLTSLSELVTTQVRRSLNRLGRGPDEFSPHFGGSATDVDDASVYAAPRVCYHLAHLTTHISLEDLDLVALKAGRASAAGTLDRLTTWMGNQGERARTVALHAGQIVRTIRDHPTHATFEPSALFYAGICLYIYSQALFKIAPTTEPPPGSGKPFPLDADPQAPDTPDTSTWLALGGGASLSGLSRAISSMPESRGVAVQILRTISARLSELAGIWRIASVFGLVLDNLVRSNEASANGDGEVP